jgi:hypothetical protein
MTTKTMRIVLIVIAVMQIVVGFGYWAHVPLFTDLWPFPAMTPLSYTFLASIFMAAAAATLWIAYYEQYAAIVGLGLDYLVILLPVSILSFQVGAATQNNAMTTYAVVALIGALFGVGLIVWGLGQPFDLSKPVPALIKWSFVIFIIVLIGAGAQIVAKVPNIIPWSITPEFAVVIGWMFIGAAAYFAYAVIRPGWNNAAGQLFGFLAYNVVLLVPLLMRIPIVAPEHQTQLFIYITVVMYSALLAIYYLFINKQTRVIGAG